MTQESRFEIIDHNVVPDMYVTYIIDKWNGDKDDPAVSVVRYIAVFRAEQLENEAGEAFDPDFTKDGGRYSYRDNDKIEPKPLTWEPLETIKTADKESAQFSGDYDDMTGDDDGGYNRYSYGAMAKRKQLYEKMMAAIDVLAERPEDQFAWAAVDEYRALSALQHEK